MKRNAELIREILISVETGIPLDFDDRKLLSSHYKLLVDAKLLSGIQMSENRWHGEELTWTGHELLALIQNNDRWQAIMRIIDDLDCYSFEIIKQVAIQQMKI